MAAEPPSLSLSLFSSLRSTFHLIRLHNLDMGPFRVIDTLHLPFNQTRQTNETNQALHMRFRLRPNKSDGN